MNTVSAVLPTIGRIKYLDTAIESILNQSKNFDEIIIFDNSLEQNLKNISKYGQNHSIKFIQAGKQLHAIDSWNSAVQNATNEYITIIGDDDILLSNYCENIHAIIEKSKVGILKAYHIDEYGNPRGDLIYPRKNILSDHEFRKSRFYNQISLFVPGTVFKKELFMKVGGFKNTFIDGLAYSDELLLTQLSYLSKNIAISKDFCWNYRIHSEQIAGVKDISCYVDRATKYVNVYEDSLITLGASNEEIYSSFTKQAYLDKACNYGIRLYGFYCGSNKNLLVFLDDLLKYFSFDKRVTFEGRLKTTLSSIKAFIGSSRMGNLIKKIKNK